MSVYQGKLLELLSIDSTPNHSFLRIRILSEDDIEFLWEIDYETAENLKTVTDLGGLHKYRLSFQSVSDSNRNKYTSFITKTYRDQSSKVHFSCSKAFVNGLHALKYNEEIPQIKNLPISPGNPDPLNFSENDDASSNRFNRKLSWKIIALVSTVFIIILCTSLLKKGEATGKAIVIAQEENLLAISNYEDETESANDFDQEEVISPFVKLEDMVTYSIPKGKVALTFDDGPSKFSNKITDILMENQVGGTFFFIGSNVKKHPDSVQYVKSHGYSIGGHSMTHPDFTKISYQMQKDELMQTNQLIEEITHEEVTLFRPPYGSKNELTIELMKESHNKIVLWNADTEDWKNQDADEIFKYIQVTKSSGSIILLHESQIVVDVLPKIIEYLKDQDLEIVTLY
ncbi:polysaccharide deacetylase family protein [Psychrobacillus glaciei]|uniref:Polysaccharide deacetylase family protein n=1 Tax=Psychrobacillus glaciei TaxID=2283160 RepID=A0A5J6SL05_9BACI|nr:polysaccharide deacetylase family protein [Psychrobacillus glaciei]QFF98429.1 polysaccharide deacetylase family protein [Psychrobacillus glaciei]